MASATARKKIRVGDRVRFYMGNRRLSATVIEDRGNIGVKGRRLLRIRWHEMETELPEDGLNLIRK